MSEFVFVRNGEEIPYSTQSVTVKEQVTVDVQKALWSGAQRLSVEALNALGIDLKFKPTQTEARIMFEKVSFMYGAIPEFATRVQEMKDMYDFLEIAYDAKTEDVEAALKAKFENADDRAEYYAQFQGALQNVKINYQAGNRALYEYDNAIIDKDQAFDPVDDFIVWMHLPILIKWLPGTYEENEIPEKRLEEIVTSSEREAVLRGQMAND